MSVFRTTGQAVAALAVLLVVWAGIIEPRYLLDVNEFDAPLPGLTQDWEGQEVALLADFQVGMWLDNKGMVSKAVREIIDRDVEVALIAGDFMYRPDSSRILEAVELVKPLPEAGVQTFAVLGNHDYSLMKEKSDARPDLAGYLEQVLEQEGIQVLKNQAARVAIEDSSPLYVVGIGSVWAHHAHPATALEQVPEGAPRIVLMHNAEAFEDVPAGTAPLALAGHTHGGQIRLPMLKSTSWLDIVGKEEVVADGWASEEQTPEGNNLYVNRGIGFSNLPVRLFTRPELTIFRLRPEQTFSMR
ncbi:MAG: metallophosphoesterase [Rhodothermales bacterium]|nr:metallophosphoesterase [Rhodothermales bacterium]MBO6778914.1 metallophosphoesterase [Rhodothermales bacterium]